eukprot:CAMPEP_0194441814 /NCGR_PEP_ID=MMETSP0176-20130528/123592_1 /TAXON_ID=216777 /ORGANISM="Proboscia alata, Strain PI-D3" /LENGTH=55 /DNA_ID=CAMNT_0039267497 /DNA_START=9 /DNA_END=172 /DNA_ORIENTATION=-
MAAFLASAVMLVVLFTPVETVSGATGDVTDVWLSSNASTITEVLFPESASSAGKS